MTSCTSQLRNTFHLTVNIIHPKVFNRNVASLSVANVACSTWETHVFPCNPSLQLSPLTLIRPAASSLTFQSNSASPLSDQPLLSSHSLAGQRKREIMRNGESAAHDRSFSIISASNRSRRGTVSSIYASAVSRRHPGWRRVNDARFKVYSFFCFREVVEEYRLMSKMFIIWKCMERFMGQPG